MSSPMSLRLKIGVTATPPAAVVSWGGTTEISVTWRCTVVTGVVDVAVDDHIEHGGKASFELDKRRRGDGLGGTNGESFKAPAVSSAWTAATTPTPNVPAMSSSQASGPFSSPRTISSGEATRADRMRSVRVSTFELCQYSPFRSGAFELSLLLGADHTTPGGDGPQQRLDQGRLARTGWPATRTRVLRTFMKISSQVAAGDVREPKDTRSESVVLRFCGREAERHGTIDARRYGDREAGPGGRSAA